MVSLFEQCGENITTNKAGRTECNDTHGNSRQTRNRTKSKQCRIIADVLILYVSGHTLRAHVFHHDEAFFPPMSWLRIKRGC